MPTESRFQLRLPREIRQWLEEDACRNDRSVNGQIVALLRERMHTQQQSDVKQGRQSEKGRG